MAHAEERLAALEFERRHADDRLAEVERHTAAVAITVKGLEQIAATTAIVSGLGPAPDLVSVIMPTRNRASLLPRAIASVQAQSHEAWELIVVDDGSTDDTQAVLEQAARADARIRVVRTDVASASAARNLGLDHVEGRFVAYLDDDNAMGPRWLRSILWAFDRNPEADVGYGARVMDDPVRGPWVEFQPWDRQRMQVHCIIDQNVLAHRAGLPELRYDTDLDLGSDWDAAMRATDRRDPVPIPVVATLYGMASSDRLSMRPDALMQWVRVQRAALRRNPLRVLCVDLASPPIADDAAAQVVGRWQATGAKVGWCAEGRAAPALTVPVYDHLGGAVRTFGPSVVALHAGRVAPSQVAGLQRAGRVFIVVAPVDTDPATLAEVAAHPLCAGVYGPDIPAPDELLPALDLVRIHQLGLPDPAGLLREATAASGPLDVRRS